MMLIDADKYPCKDCATTYCRENCDKFNDWFNTPIKYDVVHCNECAYYDNPSGKCPMTHWGEDDEYGMEIFVNNAEPDWFCSEGVRK